MSHFVLTAESAARLRSPRCARRGAAIVLVMAILSLTLAVSYAVLRSQGGTLQIQENSDKRAQARQNALTGLMIGLRKMHEANWQGVGTVLEGDLSDDDRYEVSYTTGDASLVAGTEEYELWPLRVTVNATGYSESDAGAVAVHQSRAVVQLVPRWLSSPPAAWSEFHPNWNASTGAIDSSVQPPTVYQYSRDTVEINPPARVVGKVRFRDRVSMGREYEWSNTARRRYFADLQAMRTAGWSDWRTFSGPLQLPYDRQQSELEMLQNQMQVATSDASSTALSGWSEPQITYTYRLFPGGKVYSATRLSGELSNTRLEANTTTNPLGLFYRQEDVAVQSHVVLRGTIVCDDDIFFQGTNIDMAPVDLPALVETSEPVRLPLLITGDDVLVEGGASAQLQGMLAVWDRFEVERGSSSTTFDLTGQLVTKVFCVKERSDWDHHSLIWMILYNNLLSYVSQALLDPQLAPTAYYPAYLGLLGMNPSPRIVLRPASTPARAHWLTDGGSVYAIHPDDSGLRWEIIEWTADSN